MRQLVTSRFAACAPGNQELDGRDVTIAGYIHPFEMEFRGVTTFLLTPRMRQDCRHPPPPLPDQVIFVEFPEGIDINTDPVWVTGTLRAKSVQNHLAGANYALEAHKIAPAVIPDVPDDR